MKKLVFMFVALAAISFASCGNKSASATGAKDSDTTAVAPADSAATDSAATDSSKKAAPADSAAKAKPAPAKAK